MSLSSCSNNSSNSSSNNSANVLSDFDELNNNIGKVITVFTNSGGCSGRGFTGLLVQVERGFIKLITTLPSAPRNPFGIQSGGWTGDNDDCGRRFGTVIIIPIRQIVCFIFNEV